jgi:hypothetical protein
MAGLATCVFVGSLDPLANLGGKDEAKAAWQTLDDCSALVTKPSRGLLSLSTKIQRKRSDMDGLTFQISWTDS